MKLFRTYSQIYMQLVITLLIVTIHTPLIQSAEASSSAVATIQKDPERIMEYCKPKGKDLPHDANIRIGIIERGKKEDCEKLGRFSMFETKSAELKYVAYFYKNCSVFDAFYEEKVYKIESLKKFYVVKGFSKGLVGMCQGDIRRIFVPSKYGYGRNGAGYIPGNTTLVYEVELLKVENPKYKSRRKEQRQKEENEKRQKRRMEQNEKRKKKRGHRL